MTAKQTQKWVNLGLLVVAVLVFLFFNQLFTALWDVARLPVNEEWPVAPAQLIAFVLAAGLVFGARSYKRANTFFNEVVVELSKVTWPEPKETVSSAGVVIVLIGIAAMILFVIDQLWRVAMRGVLA